MNFATPPPHANSFAWHRPRISLLRHNKPILRNQLTTSFSYSCKLLRLQTLCFDIHTNCPRVGYLRASSSLAQRDTSSPFFTNVAHAFLPRASLARGRNPFQNPIQQALCFLALRNTARKPRPLVFLLISFFSKLCAHFTKTMGDGMPQPPSRFSSCPMLFFFFTFSKVSPA